MTTIRYLADLVDFGYFGGCEVWLSQYFSSVNVWVVENLTKRSSNTLPRLVRFSAEQMLLMFAHHISFPNPSMHKEGHLNLLWACQKILWCMYNCTIVHLYILLYKQNMIKKRLVGRFWILYSRCLIFEKKCIVVA